jgi:hypothetical protein
MVAIEVQAADYSSESLALTAAPYFSRVV